MTLVEVRGDDNYGWALRSAGPPQPSFGPLLWWLTAFFHVIGRGPSALEKKEVIVAIMDHVRIANIGANTF